MSAPEEHTEYVVYDKSGAKVGVAQDSNPILIETDEACVVALHQIRDTLKLTKEERELVEVCLSTVNAKIGDTTTFGPGEILAMYDLADDHEEMRFEISACIHHISHSLKFQMEGMDGAAMAKVLDFAIQGHQALSDALSDAMKAGPFTEGEPLQGAESSDDEFLTEDEDAISSEDEENVLSPAEVEAMRTRMVPHPTRFGKDCDCEKECGTNSVKPVDPDMPPLESP